MGSNWAEEFRRQIEESEGKYRAADDLDGMDEEDEEEGVDVEEPEDEAEQVEQEDEGEEEAEEEVEQEAEKPEIEKPLPTPVATPKLSLERQRFRQELDTLPGNAPIQPAKTEVTKVEPLKPVKGETNEWAVAGTAMIGLMALSLMPTFYQAMMQAFQPLTQGFQSLSSRSQSTPVASQEWVACPYCGYQCLGYNGMPCSRCGHN